MHVSCCNINEPRATPGTAAAPGTTAAPLLRKQAVSASAEIRSGILGLHIAAGDTWADVVVLVKDLKKNHRLDGIARVLVDLRDADPKAFDFPEVWQMIALDFGGRLARRRCVALVAEERLRANLERFLADTDDLHLAVFTRPGQARSWLRQDELQTLPS